MHSHSREQPSAVPGRATDPSRLATINRLERVEAMPASACNLAMPLREQPGIEVEPALRSERSERSEDDASPVAFSELNVRRAVGGVERILHAKRT